MSPVLRRTLVGGSLAAGVALALALDRAAPRGLVPWAVASLASLLGALELARMRGGRTPRRAFAAPALLLALAGAPLLGGPLVPLADARALALAALATACLAAALARPGPALTTALLALWALPALHGLAGIDARLGTGGLAFLVVVSKVGDVFGYFVGRAVGVRRPFPRVSPNKTVAGCVASLAAGVLAGAAAAWLELPLAWQGGVLAGALVGLALNLAAQAGDLLESAVKRRSGVKDSGALFGPSGGVLDVVDSLLLTTPLALLLFPVVL